MRHQTAQLIRSFVTVLTFATSLLTLSLPVSLHAEQATTVIQVGSEIDFPPYAIVDAQGCAGGFSVELLEAVAKEMGLSIEVHPGQWPEVLANFKAGKFDLLPLVAVSEKRADMASYTKPHTVAYDSFFVRRGSHPLSSLAEAQGKEIIVMVNDAAHEALITSGFLFHIVETQTISEAMRLLAAGSHDAVLVPKLLGQIVLRQLKLEDAIETSPPIPDYSRKFAFAVQSGNTDLRDKLEQGMSLVRASGRYVAIYEKWFGDLEPQRSFAWQQILWTIGSMGLLVMLVLGWIVTLRRQMRIHVAQLKKTTVSIDILQKEVENGEQIERALRESEKLYRSLFEDMLNGVAYCRVLFEDDEPQDLIYLAVNDAFESLTGLKDVIGRKITEVIPGIRESSPQLIEILGRVAKTGRPERFEIFLAPLQMWFFISANCPEAEHFVAIFDVITERKQSEIKLQESERAKSAFLDIFNESQRIAMIGSWEWNITTNQVWWSDETYRIFGVTKHNYVPSFEANGKFLEPDELERYGKEFEHCLQTGKLLDIDVRVIVDSGLKCINAKGQVMYDDSGLPLRFIGTVLDVTLYKRAEDRIKRNELRLKTVTDVLQHPCETIQGFLDYALDQAIALTESDIGFIYHYCEDRREFVLNSWSKKAMAECAIDKPPTCYKLDKTGLWGEVVRQRRSIIVNDFQAVNPLKKGYPEGHVQITKFMTVPIFKGGDIVGVIGLGNKRTDYENFDVLEILLLMGVVWKVIDRKQFEVTLLASLREKETLLREIHHRVKNNLQIISSLLKLQANYCKDDTLQQIFNESQLRIRAMASVHVQLYKSQNFTSINFADYTQETATQLFRAYNTWILDIISQLWRSPRRVKLFQADLKAFLRNIFKRWTETFSKIIQRTTRSYH